MYAAYPPPSQWTPPSPHRSLSHFPHFAHAMGFAPNSPDTSMPAVPGAQTMQEQNAWRQAAQIQAMQTAQALCATRGMQTAQNTRLPAANQMCFTPPAYYSRLSAHASAGCSPLQPHSQPTKRRKANSGSPLPNSASLLTDLLRLGASTRSRSSPADLNASSNSRARRVTLSTAHTPSSRATTTCASPGASPSLNHAQGSTQSHTQPEMRADISALELSSAQKIKGGKLRKNTTQCENDEVKTTRKRRRTGNALPMRERWYCPFKW